MNKHWPLSKTDSRCASTTHSYSGAFLNFWRIRSAVVFQALIFGFVASAFAMLCSCVSVEFFPARRRAARRCTRYDGTASGSFTRCRRTERRHDGFRRVQRGLSRRWTLCFKRRRVRTAITSPRRSVDVAVLALADQTRSPEGRSGPTEQRPLSRIGQPCLSNRGPEIGGCERHSDRRQYAERRQGGWQIAFVISVLKFRGQVSDRGTFPYISNSSKTPALRVDGVDRCLWKGQHHPRLPRRSRLRAVIRAFPYSSLGEKPIPSRTCSETSFICRPPTWRAFSRWRVPNSETTQSQILDVAIKALKPSDSNHPSTSIDSDASGARSGATSRPSLRSGRRRGSLCRLHFGSRSRRQADRARRRRLLYIHGPADVTFRLMRSDGTVSWPFPCPIKARAAPRNRPSPTHMFSRRMLWLRHWKTHARHQGYYRKGLTERGSSALRG